MRTKKEVNDLGLATPKYVNRLKLASKKKYARELVKVANQRLRELREFLKDNPEYHSPSLSNLENKTYPNFEFKMPYTGKKAEQKGGIIDRFYRTTYDFLKNKTSTIEGIVETCNKKDARMKESYVKAYDKLLEAGKEEVQSKFDRGEGDFYDERDMRIALEKRRIDIDKWNKDDKNHFWRLYNDFKNRKEIVYSSKEDGISFREDLYIAMMLGGDDEEVLQKAVDINWGKLEKRDIVKELLEEEQGY